ncbi:receptor expression-enhancing protein 5 [Aethina tumida]|uniref:receptor expression-enhancing protein 5 n=1 Tax=Aethina tumida TaxID=116153 RepID=UPI00096B50D7|nr:receptor expression-enhancing protein 5 [Aethina tumida]
MAGRVNEIKEQIAKSLHDSSKPWTPLLKNLEVKTGVDRLYIFLGSVALIALWLVFGFAAQLVCNFVGFLYPAYVSIRAIESANKDDDTKWLTYWVVFALFSLVEFFADFIVGWFPLYWLIKCLFLVWLMVPIEFNGSLVLYKKIVRPYFLKHQQSVDSILDKAKEGAHKLLEKTE